MIEKAVSSLISGEVINDSFDVQAEYLSSPSWSAVDGIKAENNINNAKVFDPTPPVAVSFCKPYDTVSPRHAMKA